MSVNSKYLLQASHLFCMSVHLFIGVLQCSGVGCGVGLWGCLLLQGKASMWGQGSPSLGDLKQSHSFGWKAVPALEKELKSKSNLILSLASHEFLGWFVQYDHSWEVLCGPWCCSRLCELTDFTVLLYSQGMFVHHCPLGFVLVENLPGTNPCVAEEWCKCCAAVQQAGRVQSHPLSQASWQEEWEVYMERPYLHLQCFLVLETSERIMILVSWRI